MKEMLLQDICDLHERMTNVHFFEEISSLPHGEFLIMQYLYEYDNDIEERTISKIAKRYKVSTPAISRTVRTLLTKEWVERLENEIDRRVIYISLTDEGRSVYLEQASILKAYVYEVFELMDQEDLKEWIRIGNTIVNHMEKVLSKGRQGKELEGKR